MRLSIEKIENFEEIQDIFPEFEFKFGDLTISFKRNEKLEEYFDITSKFKNNLIEQKLLHKNETGIDTELFYPNLCLYANKIISNKVGVSSNNIADNIVPKKENKKEIKYEQLRVDVEAEKEENKKLNLSKKLKDLIRIKNTDIVFKNAVEASKHFNVHPTTIREQLKKEENKFNIEYFEQ